MEKLTDLSSWNKLKRHFHKIKDVEIKSLFTNNSTRFNEFTIQLNDILLDYSKNRLDKETIKLLIDLAEECGVKKGIKAMFNGDVINNTEKRSVLHVALRNRSNKSILVDGVDVMPDINKVLDKSNRNTKE